MIIIIMKEHLILDAYVYLGRINFGESVGFS